MPSSPNRDAPTRRRQADRRNEAEQALLDAAARLFARRGVESTSMADIGAEAGYSRGLANHHYGSRAALVERLAARTQRRFLVDVDVSSGGVAALLAVADSYLEQVARAGVEVRAFSAMWGSSFAEEAPLRAVFVEDDARFRRGVSELLRAGQAAATVRSDVDVDGFAVVFVALLRGIGAQFAVDPGGVDIAAARATCRDLVQSFLHADAHEEG